MNDLIIWSYFLIGTLFVFYFFAIFIQRRIKSSIRIILSMLFLVIGFFFFNTAGEMLTDGNVQFALIALISAFVMALVGLVCVLVLYRENVKNRIAENKRK